MATNNFKAFGIGAGANVTSQTDYEALTALLTGFQSGKASSAQINKALRQSSTMSYVLAQFISDSLNADVLDNGAPANILASMKAAMTKLTPGRLLNVQTLTQSGMYTKTPGTNLIFVRLWGAGGGGGNTSVVGGGGSGAGGGYCEGIFDASYFSTTTFIVGLGGVAVAGNTQANGGSGGRTQFGNLIGASGGGGGGSIAAGGIPDLGANRLAVYGQSGQGSQGGIGGVGGSTFGSFGGLPHASSPGDAGSFPGGGGAGGTKIATSQYFASGAGANGLIIIEEYS